MKSFIRARIVAMALAVAAATPVVSTRAGTPATYIGADGGSYNLNTNWSGGVIPNGAFDVTINGVASNVAVNTAGSISVETLTITAGDALNLSNGDHLTITGGSINNAGAINMLSNGSNFTQVLITGNTILSGGGTINMQKVSQIGGTGTLTIASGTIAGEANYNQVGLGQNDITIINQAAGVINANIDGFILTVDPGVGGLTNTGTMKATNGGILRLSGNGGGDFTNTNGLITAIGTGATTPSIVRMTGGASVIGGTFTTTGGGVVETESGASATLTGVTINGTYTFQNAAVTTMNGTITNKGDIFFNSNGSGYTRFVMGSDVTLTGGGTLTMQKVSYIEGGFTLTNFNNTIQGEANYSGVGLGINDITFINQAAGVVNANVTGLVLTVDPGAGGVTNTGTLKATNGGIFRLSGNDVGTFNNAGGTIKASGTDSIVRFSTAAKTSGGTLSTDTGGQLEIPANETASFTNVTIDGNFVIQNAAVMRVNGSLVNKQSILMNSNGSGYTTFIMDSDTTLTGGGTINMQKVSYIEGAFTLTNVNNTIQGESNYSGVGLGTNDITFINQAAGVVNANVAAGILTVDPGAGGVTNAGTMKATNGGILRISGNGVGTFNNTGGVIKASGPGSLVRFSVGAQTSGGTLSTDTGGQLEILVGESAVFSNLTIDGSFVVQNSASMNVNGAIANKQSILLNSNGGGYTRFILGSDTSLTGGGTITMQSIAYIQGAFTLTNVDNTIAGEASFSGLGLGLNDLTLLNQAAGVINANVSAKQLIVDPGAGGFTNNGTARASNHGTLYLSGNGAGTFTNNGTYEALASSDIFMSDTAVLTNNVAGVLTGGTYRAVSGPPNNYANLTLRGAAVTKIAANTTVELSGIGSVIQFEATSIDSSLTQNDGTFKVLNSRSFLTGNAYTNNGTTLLGGGTFTPVSITNNAAGLIKGFGTIGVRPLNHGTIESNGGTLTLVNGIQGGSGTIQVDAGSTLDLSGGASDSSADNLVHNGTTAGSLKIGNNSVLVSKSYTNANFGSGNSFDRHANVSTTGGQILAVGDNIGVLSGDVVAGTIAFGNVHVGTSPTKNYKITNSADAGPDVLFVKQTSVNGGNITDARLTGAGVTAGNVGPLAINTPSADQAVTFNATSAGALTNQKVNIETNFDNVNGAVVNITGAAFNLASAAPIASPVNFGKIHVGGSFGTSSISIFNNAPVSAFTEGLDAAAGTPTGDASKGGTPVSNLAAGAPAATTITVGLGAVNTNVAGAKSGTVPINFTSNGTASGLANTPLPGLAQSVTVQGEVWNLAAGTIGDVNFGNHHVGDVVASQAVSVTNSAPVAFSEKLNASLGTVSGAGFSADPSATSVSLLPAGQSNSTALLIKLDTSSAGSLTGTAVVHLTSDGQGVGTVGNSGLGQTALADKTANLSADITTNGNLFRFASASAHTPEPATFKLHVGDVVNNTLALSIKNTAANDGFSEKLDASIGGATAGVTATGSISLLAPQATDSTNLVVGVDSSSAGHKAGTATISLVSNGAGTSNLGTTPIGTQTVNIVGDVYRLAAPGSIAAVDLGLTRVGTAFSAKPLAVSNTAAADGFSEGLDAAVTGTTPDATTAGASTNVAAGATSGAGNQISVNLSNTSSAGPKSGTVTVGFASNGATTSTLGITAITGPAASQTVNISGTVIEYAHPAFAKAAGTATLTPNGTEAAAYTLNFVTQNEFASDSATLDLSNLLVALPQYQDSLAGTFSIVSGAGTFNLSNFNDILNSTAIAPGGTLGNFVVSFSNLGQGIYTEQLKFLPRSTDDVLADAAIPGLANGITLDIHVTVNGNGAPIPEPASLGLLAIGAAGLLIRRRR